MNNPGPYSMPQQRPRPCLQVTQGPERAKVVLRGKEKDRKPIDPPPIVQFYHENTHPSHSLYFHNPYYVCTVTLWHAERDEPKVHEGQSVQTQVLTPLLGNCSSSLNKLKDLNNQDGAYFVFMDISASVAGPARLKFQLVELIPRDNNIVVQTEILSEVFDVQSAKDWEGPKESTPLSRSFADQGVRLRLRKESRSSANRRMLVPPPTTGPNTPIRPQPPGPHSQSYGSHSSSAEDGEPSAKRPRSSTMSMGYSSIPGPHGHPAQSYGPVPGAAGYPYGYQYPAGTQGYPQFPGYGTQRPPESSNFMNFANSNPSTSASHYGSQAATYGSYGPSYASGYGAVNNPSSGYPASYTTAGQTPSTSAYASATHDPYRGGVYGAGSSNPQTTRDMGDSRPRLPPIQSTQGVPAAGQAVAGTDSGHVKDEQLQPYGANRGS